MSEGQGRKWPSAVVFTALFYFMDFYSSFLSVDLRDIFFQILGQGMKKKKKKSSENDQSTFFNISRTNSKVSN